MRHLRHTLPIKEANKPEKISIIIPAAGLGTRMKSYGPKSLIPIGNTNIINTQLKIISEKINVPYEIILVGGFEAEKLFKNTPHNIIKVENEQYENTNVIRSIGIELQACTTEDILIIYGDLLFNHQTLNIQFGYSWLLTNNTMTPDEIGCNVNEGIISHLSYGLPLKWSQIGYFTKKEFKALFNICCKKENSKSFGFEVINIMIEKGHRFKQILPENSIINDIDCLKDIQVVIK
jgi:hypothetical protein